MDFPIAAASRDRNYLDLYGEGGHFRLLDSPRQKRELSLSVTLPVLKNPTTICLNVGNVNG